MNAAPLIRIGTRGSPLALAQAREVRDRLVRAHAALAPEGAVEIVTIRTTGDRVLDRTLAEIGGKGLFTKEIEEALLEGRIDLAVHSMKDMQTWLPEGLAVGCVLEREDPRDAFISPRARGLDDLAPGAVVGTASLRRRSQVLARRGDVRVVPLRGNVQTRLAKLEAGEVDATLLALAGLRRLGMAHVATATLEPDEMLPAACQGAIGIETRADDAGIRAWIDPLNHPGTADEVAAERALLATLDGSCRTPIAALARRGTGGRLVLDALLAMPDGSRVLRAREEGPAAEAEAIGRRAGEALKSRAGPDFLAALATEPAAEPPV